MLLRSGLSAFTPLVLLLAVAVSWPARTATLVVDDDGSAPFATIQAAIDAADPGVDEVFVRCGTYVENLVMRDGVALRGQNPDCAVIDGGDNGLPAVSLEAAGPQTVLEGFTVRNGRALNGGGVRILGGSPVITRNVIRDNGSPLFGGFYNYGGGIYASSGGFDPAAAPRISYNVVRDNRAFVGGGILLVDVNGAVVTSNLIVGNEGSFGGGLYTGFATSELVNNTIAGNTADYGGGLCDFDSNLVINNNVFVWNLAYGTPGDVYFIGPGMRTFGANDSFGNMPFEAYGGPFPGPGNISVDPRFVDLDGGGFSGFQPRSDSPLIDRGEPLGAPAEDLLGIPRPVDGDASGVAVPDIGARENQGLTGLRLAGTGLVWDPGVHTPQDYNVYRGDLDELKSTGVYTQDPLVVLGARHFCGLSGPALVDADVPDTGRAYFYLAVALGQVEGTLGFDSGRVERPRTEGCQS